MTHDLTRREIEEQLPAYVLGALEPDEMLAVAAYLAAQSDSALQERVQALEGAVVHMARDAPHVPLPPGPRQQLLERVHADLQATARRVRPAVVPPPRSSRWQGIGAMLRPLAWAAVGALLVLLLGGGYVARLQESARASQSRIEQLEAGRTLLEASNQVLQQSNQQLQQQLVGWQGQMEVLAGAQHQVQLAGTEAAPGSAGTIYFGQGVGVVVVHGLSPLAKAHSYELWLMTAEGEARAIGLLSVSQKEPSSHTITLPADALDYATIGISVEPAGGSPTPTGPVVMLGEVE